MEMIVARAALVGHDSTIEPLVRAELQERLDQWLAEAHNTAGGRMFGYNEERNGLTVGLLHRPSLDPWDDFTCLNSLRDVEPTVGLVFHDRWPRRRSQLHRDRRAKIPTRTRGHPSMSPALSDETQNWRAASRVSYSRPSGLARLWNCRVSR